MRFFERPYSRIYRLVSGDNILHIDPRAIHAHLTVTLSTSVLMWGYAVCAFLTIDSPVPCIVGFTCSFLHLLSPLLFRGTGNLLFVTLFMLTTGIIHQGTYSFFTGGFFSPILIWYGIIPMLAGVIEGYKSIIISSSLVGTIALSFLYLELEGYEFPYLISDAGMLASQAMIVFGWIGLSTLIIFHYVKTTSNYEYRLRKETDKVQGLLQTLLHDISNRVQSVGLANFHLKKAAPEREKNEHFQSIDSNISSLNRVIHSVRKMTITELGNRRLKLVPCPLAQPVSAAIFLLNDRLKQKKIEVVCRELELEVLCDPYIFENQVLVNIISNCIKFSHEGSVIEIHANKKDALHANLYIRDHGIGIPEHILAHLFNPNFPTSRLGTQSEKGSGLGMTIAKTMCEKMGCELEIASSTEGPNKGTLFTITLKIA